MLVTYTAFKLYTDIEYNGLLNNQRYSTDEINTGKTWIDGKPIYRAIYTGNYPTTTTIGEAVELFLLNHTGISDVTHVEGYFMNNSSLYILPMTAYWRKSDGMIKAHQETTNSAGTYRIIIEYTKTTD